MGEKIRFTKMQGCGNDYVYINCFTEQGIKNPAELARAISDRHYGVGGDGMILIEPPKNEKSDAFMHMFNSDGSEGSMCGNGIRCVAKYVYDHRIIPASRKKTVIDTPSGLREIALEVDDDDKTGKVKAATVGMRCAKLTSTVPEMILIGGKKFNFIGVDMGNPHAVYFLDDNPELINFKLEELRLDVHGPDFERHERFPARVNSEFVKVISRSEIKMRVWERGSGETLACGTGATAAAFAGVVSGKLDSDKRILVHLTGGDLEIKIEQGETENQCYMTGPAVEVFSGEFSF